MKRVFEFVKLHGAGNDFVFFDGTQRTVDFSEEEVAWLCDRHKGIGADGVIIVRDPRDDGADGFMDYRNADGSIAQMCGNGVRCFAKYLVDHEMVANKPLLNVETRAGVKTISYTTDENGLLLTATVDMGVPILNPQEVPTTLAFNAMTGEGEVFVKDTPVKSPFGDFDFTCISMGNPHAVTFVDDCDEIDVSSVGSYFERCEAFPERANIEFATVRDDGIHMRVFERGCGETLACGTGACATGVAAYLTGRAGRTNDIVLLGGTLHVEYAECGSVLMTGPAEESFKGTVSL